MLQLALRRPGGRAAATLGRIDERLAGIDARLGSVMRARVATEAALGRAIAETLDLGEVLQRTLEATKALQSVDGGRVGIPLRDGSLATETWGRVAGPERSLDGPPDGSPYTHGSVTWETVGPDALRSGLVVPLGDGSLSVFSTLANAFDAEAAATLAAIARRAEPAVRNALEHLQVLEEAATDARTGFGSARAFEQTLPQAINAARRHARPLCLIQIDMDDFGQVNKRYGHARGDAVLSEFGRRVLGTIRGSDAIFRHSGGADEFFLLLPETTREDARHSYRRLYFEVSETPFDEVGRVTMSSGLVELQPDDTQRSLLQRADTLARRAKERGKDRLLGDDGEEWPGPQ